MFGNFFKYYFIGFLLIFGPVLNGTSFGSYGDIIFLLSCLIIIYNLTKVELSKIPKIHFYFTLLVILMIFYPILTTLLFDFEHLSFSLQVFIRPIRILITFLGCYFFIKSIYSNPNITENEKGKFIFRIIYYSIVFHALIMCLQFVYPDFRDVIYQYTVNKQELGDFILNFRMGGLVGTGAATLSVFQAIGFLLYPFVKSDLSNRVTKIIHYLFQILIIISIVICGRSGLYAIVLFMPILSIIIKKNFIAVILRYILLYSVVFISIYLLIFSLLNIFEDNKIINPISRTLDIITSSKESGEFNNETTNIIKDMIIFPKDFITLIFGKPFYFVDSSSIYRELQSDIGYIVYLWSFGIIGFMIYHSFYFYNLIMLYNKRNENNYFKASFFLTLIFLFFQFKELFIYARVGFSIYIFLYFGAYFQSKINTKSINSNFKISQI